MANLESEETTQQRDTTLPISRPLKREINLPAFEDDPLLKDFLPQRHPSDRLPSRESNLRFIRKD